MTLALYRGLTGLIPVIVSLLSVKGLFHLFQLESYQFPGFYRSVKRNPVQAWMPGVLSAVASLVLMTIARLLLPGEHSIVLQLLVLALSFAAAAALGTFIRFILGLQKAKKPFVYTARVKRLYGFCGIMLGTAAFFVGQFSGVILASLWPVLLPVWLSVCALVAWGLEKIISEAYFRSARGKLLSQSDLIRIGITGSYGKTSVKQILGTILEEKYSVLITPKSFNTPMGVTRTIRERLLPSHQVFIAEMGARHVGDIKELCRLVKPEIGILSSVGPQHLDTFKTLDRVASTKYELIDALPADGHGFFADDGAICKQLYDRTGKPKTLVALATGSADLWCENTEISAEGSTFDLCFKDGERLQVTTRLLGEHSIQNILLAASVAKHLGLTKNQILRGIRRIEPVPSRMELIKNPNSYTIINDGFNANPVSAQAALSILSQFPKRRIIITPGMVELGAEEAAFNQAFGRQIAKAVDIAIIVGKKRVQPILDGLNEAGFPKENIHHVDSLEQSTKVLQTLVHKDDTVLYENDLPDNYQEN